MSTPQTHCLPFYNIIVYERTVFECLNPIYCWGRSGAEQNAGRWDKILEPGCSCAFGIDDRSLLPGDSFSMLYRITVNHNSEKDLDTVYVIVSRFWSSNRNEETLFALWIQNSSIGTVVLLGDVNFWQSPTSICFYTFKPK